MIRTNHFTVHILFPDFGQDYHLPPQVGPPLMHVDQYHVGARNPETPPPIIPPFPHPTRSHPGPQHHYYTRKLPSYFSSP